MKYTKIPEDTFKNIQLNEGIIVKSFEPETAEYGDLIGAVKADSTSFKATPTYSDFGADIANCPKNSAELKKLESWEVTLDATLLTVTASTIKDIIGAADVDSEDATHIVPRNDVKSADFSELWWIGDYSDKNDNDNAGFVAIHMMNTLSTGGLAIKPGDRKKGEFAVTYTAHYSIEEQDTVPFEVFVKSGT